MALALACALAAGQSGTTSEEAEALHNKGLSLFREGKADEGREAVFSSLRIHEQLGLRESQAVNLRALALIHDGIGERQKSLEFYNRALAIARAVRNTQLEASTLRDIGTLYYNLDENARALQFMRLALQLQRREGQPKALARTLFNTGEISRYGKDFAKARPLFEEALRLARETGDRECEADALSSLAALDIRNSRAAIDQALAIRLETKDSRGEASTRIKLGLHWQSNGDFAAAIGEFEKAAAIHGAANYRGGEAFARQALAIAERERPGGGLARAIAEMSKAVDLAESLRQRLSDRDLRATYIGYVQNRYEFLIDACVEQGDLASAFAWSERARARALVETLTGAGVPAARPPGAVSAANAQSSLLDAGTVILEYALSEPKSHLFAIDKRGLRHRELPGRAKLEAIARNAYEQYRKAGTRPDAGALARTLLLDEAASATRVVVVADGALQYLPFADLTPATVVLAPSVSAVAALRPNGAVPPVSRRLAVFADPEAPQYARLPFARTEADWILEALGPPQERARLVGAEVTKRSVAANPAQILHFAAHGILDSARPEGSELVLSGGSLRLRDIQAMRLRSDLVVLSACETALGKDMKREGLMGLTHAFQLAGASRVVASLWKVDDRATAELMKHFYTAMFRDSKPPAAALRAAQDTLSRTKRWSHPYYWAGFVLQGEWR